MFHLASKTFAIALVTLVNVAITKPSLAGFLYFADEDTDSIRRSDLDGSNVITIISGQVAPRGVAIDEANSKLYWTDGHAVPRTIQRANLDGTGVETLVAKPLGGTLNTLALDLVNGKMYFGDSIAGLIQRSNLDGSNLETIASGVDDPVGIAVDPLGGSVYWTGGSKTQRANLDGTGIVDLLAFGARDLALDIANGKMYIGGGGETIRRANLDGSGLETLVTTVGFSQMGVDFTDGKMYWSDLTLDQIRRSNLDGSNPETVISSGLSLPRDIAILNPQPVPEPTSVALFGLGALGMLMVTRCRKNQMLG